MPSGIEYQPDPNVRLIACNAGERFQSLSAFTDDADKTSTHLSA